MAEVTVEVAGRSYRLGCDDGEEQHLSALAARIDAEARRISKGMNQMAEGRLMLMAALLVADKLHEAEAQITEQALALREAEQALAERPSGLPADEEAEISGEIDRLSERLERLAEAVSPSPGLPFGGGGTA